MSKCKECGSHAINPFLCGRDEGVDLDLCDVCYWRKRSEYSANFIKKAREESELVSRDGKSFVLVPYWFMKD